MKVFHGTTLIVDTPLVGVGRKNLDFGEGFYLTSIRQQAIEWAQRTRDEALIRLQYEKPNNQICLIRQELIDKFLVFKEAILLNDAK